MGLMLAVLMAVMKAESLVDLKVILMVEQMVDLLGK
jgi:hypothetical protein